MASIALRHQFLRVEGRAAGEQFVEQHAEAVDVAAGVDVQPAHLRLFRAHVGRGADELVELREDRGLSVSPAFGGLGDAEVDDLGDGHAVVEGDEDVRGLDVPVDDALLVGVLDGLADLDEESRRSGWRAGLVAVVGDADAADQFHDEVGPAGVGGAGVEDLGDVGDGPSSPGPGARPRSGRRPAGVHAELDDLEGDARRTGSVCSAT
jgi:hypothetical protein